MEVYTLDFDEKFVRSVIDNGVSKVVKFSFPKGKVLEKHSTTSDILVLVVSGQVKFKASEEVEREVKLQPGQLLSLKPDIVHAVEALEDSVMILILTPSPSAHTIFKPINEQRN